MKPRCSVVVALMFTWFSVTPSICASERRISSRYGDTLGDCASSVMSALPTLSLRTASICSTASTKRRLSAPFHTGSVSGKVHADVAEPRRAQHGVTQRMQHHVAVAMRQYAARVRNAHAAEDDRIPRTEGMHVEARTNAHQWLSSCRSPSMAPASARSSAVVTLMLSARPATRRGR